MKRIKYFDLLRVICFSIIIFYHMVAQLPINGVCSQEAIEPFVATENMQLGTLAVAVFFMISGASLMYTTKDKFQLIPFYLKRYMRLLIPFYVVTFIHYIYKAIMVHDLAGVYIGGIPVWRWIFTILGIDEWASMHGILTFSRGIGEWFLGALVIISLIFPLLRWLMLKNQKVFMAAATVLYVIVILFYKPNIPLYMSLLTKGFDFVVGMWLGLNWQKIDKKWKYVTIPVVIVFFICPWKLPIPETLKIFILALAFLISFSFLEERLQNCDMKAINWLSKYSYELFLVHHLVIYELTRYRAPYINGVGGIILHFLLQLVVIFAFSVLAKFLADQLIRFATFILKKIRLL